MYVMQLKKIHVNTKLLLLYFRDVGTADFVKNTTVSAHTEVLGREKESVGISTACLSYTERMFNDCKLCTLYSPAQQPLYYTLTWTSVFISYCRRRSTFSFYLFISLPFITFLIPYLHFLTWLCFVTVVINVVNVCYNLHCLSLSRLIHSIQCSSTVFAYRVLERRLAQGTLMDYAWLHNMKNSKTLNIHNVRVHGNCLSTAR
jgi:hypothetical protein